MLAGIFAATAASADVDFGTYARSLGMGGAGIALVDQPVITATLNPAAAGLLNRTHFVFPSLSMRSQGASVNYLQEHLKNTYDLDGDGAIQLARDLGKNDTRLDMDFVTGLTVGSIGITADAQAVASVTPSQAFKDYANGIAINQSDYGNVYADVRGQAVWSMPAIALATRVKSIKPESGNLYLGTRLKMLRGIARSERVFVDQANSLAQGRIVLDTITNTDSDEMGFGADIGALWSPAGKGNLTYAITADNFLAPTLGTIDLDTVINLGIAGQPTNKFVWAVDLANLTGAYNTGAKYRMGAEYKLGNSFAVRGGYASSSWTFGVGVLGVDFAFSNRVPFTIGRTMVF